MRCIISLGTSANRAPGFCKLFVLFFVKPGRFYLLSCGRVSGRLLILAVAGCVWGVEWGECIIEQGKYGNPPTKSDPWGNMIALFRYPLGI